MLNLVRRVCWWWHILALAIADRRLFGLLLSVAVVGYRPARYRSSNESSTSCPSPHAHRNSLFDLLSDRDEFACLAKILILAPIVHATACTGRRVYAYVPLWQGN